MARRHGRFAVDSRGRIVAITVENAQLSALDRRRALERLMMLAWRGAAIFLAAKVLVFALHGFQVVGS